MNYLLENKASRLGVRSSDPGALNGVDADKLSASAKAMGLAMKPMRIATQSNKVSWTVAAAAGRHVQGHRRAGEALLRLQLQRPGRSHALQPDPGRLVLGQAGA